MPIYEYVCGQCGHHLEALQNLPEEPLVYCPECGEAALKKKVSAAAFRLKGTGWYETDFKNSEQDKKKSETDNKKEAGKDRSDTSEGQKSGKEEVDGSSGDSGSDTKAPVSSKTASSKSETKPVTKSGGSGSGDGLSKPSTGTSPGND